VYLPSKEVKQSRTQCAERSNAVPSERFHLQIRKSSRAVLNFLLIRLVRQMSIYTGLYIVGKRMLFVPRIECNEVSISQQSKQAVGSCRASSCINCYVHFSMLKADRLCRE
jgi:hypothetical protein